jgi:hypothetical protein
VDIWPGGEERAWGVGELAVADVFPVCEGVVFREELARAEVGRLKVAWEVWLGGMKKRRLVVKRWDGLGEEMD